MITVVATGVFDIIHPGHILYLTEAKALGDELIVVVACDNTAETRKRKPLIPEDQRMEIVSQLRLVDKAVLGDESDFFKPISEIKPDVIALGADQKVDEEQLREMLKAHGLNTKIVRVSAHWDAPLNASKKIHKKIREL
ncbi:MAG: adenylyltransferase/cytidyltransferase family protein [Methanobacteriota archaeon]